jgi:hypothetical protein
MPEEIIANNLPNATNCWYDSQVPVWNFLQDLLDGQDAVKAKTTTYLPKDYGEDEDGYKNRLALALFFEDYRDCTVGLTGLAFRKPPVLNSDVPDEIKGLEEVKDANGKVTQEARKGFAENIDNAGTCLNVFLQRVFQDGFFGHTFIVVDMPMADGSVQTAQDEIARGARSYWVQRRAIDTPNWRWAVINGRIVPTQASFIECTKEPSGLFGEIEVTRFRVYRLNELGEAEWQLWEQQSADDKTQIVMIASDTIRTKKGVAMRRLPIAVHYGEYEGFWKSRPPLKTIADISKAYYQKYADLTWIEHNICAVTLAIESAPPADNPDKQLGSTRVVYTGGVGQKAYFLEVNGESISSLESDLRNLEKRMIHKGLDFVREGQPVTATEAVFSFTERTSKLSMMVQSLKDCAEEALSIMAEMEGLDQGGSISIGVDSNSLVMSPDWVRVLSDATQQGNLSKQTFWKILERMDILQNFDPKNEDGLLEAAAQAAMERQTQTFNSGGLPA